MVQLTAVCAKILSIPHRDRYQLLTLHGIPATIASNEIEQLRNHSAIDLNSNPLPIRSLREVTRLSSNTSIRRCPCVRAELACTTHCHTKQRTSFCRNKDVAEAGLDLEAEAEAEEAEGEIEGAAHAQQEDSDIESTIPN